MGGNVESTPIFKYFPDSVLSAVVESMLLFIFTSLFLPQLITSREKIIAANTNAIAAILIITAFFLLAILKFINLILMPFFLHIPQYG